MSRAGTGAPGARRARRLVAVALAGAVLAACSGGGKKPPATTAPAPPPTTTTTTPPPTVPVVDRSADYGWRPLTIGAGGYVTGLASSSAGAGALYARTDTAGAFRWDEASGRWQPLLTAASVPDAADHRTDYGVDGLAVAPGDPARVVLIAGDDYNPEPGKPVEGSGRVLRSTDGGRTWQASAAGVFAAGNQNWRQVGERVAIDPSNPDHVVLGTRREGLWTSTDGAATFTRVPTTVVPAGSNDGDDQAGITFVSFDPANPATVYAGVAGAGVYRSDDGGRTWRLAVPVPRPAVVPTLGAVAPGVVYVGFNPTDDDKGALVAYDRTSGAVRTITPPADTGHFQVAVDPRRPEHLVALDYALRGGELWVSDDAARTWRRTTARLTSAEIPWLGASDTAGSFALGRVLFDPVVEGRLWIASGVGVWMADAVGAGTVELRLRSAGLEQTVTAGLVVPDGGAPVSAIADWQGFLHTDADTFPARPLYGADFASGTSVDGAGLVPGDLAWIGGNQHLRVAKAATSSDGGRTWRPVTGLPPTVVGGEIAVAADGRSMVVVPTSLDGIYDYLQNPRGIYVSGDAGATWRHLTDVGGTNAFHRFFWWLRRRAVAADRVTPATFYLLSDDGRFFGSGDGGATWTERQAPPCTDAVDCHVGGQVQAAPGRAGEVWASTVKAGLWRTTDGGTTAWQRVPGLAEASAFGFGAPATPGGPPAVYVWGTVAGERTPGLYRTDDDGATWSLVARAPGGVYQDLNVVAGDPDRPGVVYVGFTGAGFMAGRPA